MGFLGIIIQWMMQYWVAVTIATVAVGAGVTAVVVYENIHNDETDAGVTVDVEEKVLADEKPDPVLSGKKTANTPSPASSIPLLPPDETPWGQGPSDQKSAPSSGGTLPSNQTPWGTGPSQ